MSVSENRPPQNDEDVEMEMEVDDEEYFLPEATLGNAPLQRKRNDAPFAQSNQAQSAPDDSMMQYLRVPESNNTHSQI